MCIHAHECVYCPGMFDVEFSGFMQVAKFVYSLIALFEHIVYHLTSYYVITIAEGTAL